MAWRGTGGAEALRSAGEGCGTMGMGGYDTALLFFMCLASVGPLFCHDIILFPGSSSSICAASSIAFSSQEMHGAANNDDADV